MQYPIEALNTQLEVSDALSSSIKDLVVITEDITVTDQKSLDKAGEYRKSMTGLLNEAEKARKAAKQPYFLTGKRIDEIYKDIVGDLKEANEKVKKLCNAWVDKEAKRIHKENLIIEAQRVTKRIEEEQAANKVPAFDEVFETEETEFLLPGPFGDPVVNKVVEAISSKSQSISKSIEMAGVLNERLQNVHVDFLILDDKKVKLFIKENKNMLIMQCELSEDLTYTIYGLTFKLTSKTAVRA